MVTAHWTRSRQQAHGRLLLSLALSLAGVAIIKHSLPMDCPWDLQPFGGDQSFIGLFSSWPAHRAPNACFPAGHASIGYAWLGLYFFCLQLYPALAKPALLFAMLLGISLGLVQQLRGAHFISHDITSAAWCWSMACLCAYWPLLRRALQRTVHRLNFLNNTARGTL
ncbi:MAG: phosphatase PAP2 family protein [Rheinheimera sp.]|nr:phosphatase PAP2 family protein [Rheinheimera sp.]